MTKNLLIWSGIFAVVVSCDMFKLREREDPDTSPGWILPDSAHLVIQNLKNAFENINIVNYSNCFDEDFVFLPDSVTYSRNPDLFVGWTKEVEVQTASVMFSQIRSNPEVSFELESADTAIDTISFLYSYLIHMNLQNGEALSINGRSLFTTIARDDGLYYIIRWEDFQPDTLIPGSITWSELKGRFKQ